MIRNLAFVILVSIVVAGCDEVDPRPAGTAGDGSTDGQSSAAGQNGASQSGPSAVQLPENFPDDVPIYPDSTFVEVKKSENANTGEVITTFKFDAKSAATAIGDFYKKSLLEQLWAVQALPSGTSINAKKGERSLHVDAMVPPWRSGITEISISFSSPGTPTDAAQP